MTDNEIIKALECCSANSIDACQNCYYRFDSYDNGCAFQLSHDALDLINRQKAEIERLKYCNETNISSIATLHERLKTAKAEAYKEFAERLKEKSYPFPCAIGVENAVTIRTINDLLKEMVGDNDE